MYRESNTTHQNGSDTDPVFVVSRGNRRDTNEIIKELAQVVRENNNPRKVESLQNKLKDVNKCYGGTFFSNSFKVSRAIDLTAVAFFGPSKEKCATYFVQIDIFRSKTNIPEPSVKLGRVKTYSHFDAELVWIELVEPIHVIPDVWHTIQFCLDGPNTFRCEKTIDDASIVVGPNNEIVNFVFLRGSMQMPQMQFKMSKKDTGTFWASENKYGEWEQWLDFFNCCS